MLGDDDDAQYGGEVMMPHGEICSDNQLIEAMATLLEIAVAELDPASKAMAAHGAQFRYAIGMARGVRFD